MNIMAHVVAGYPSPEECVELMLGMQKLGVEMIEVQIPFSDPIADGETIMRANDRALEHGMTVKSSFALLRQAREQGLKSNIYIMSYVQKLIHCGFEDFCRWANEVEAAGLIIPDLPFDSPEYAQLASAEKKYLLEIVPVVSPGMDPQRLTALAADKKGLVYLTSTKGITGNKLNVSAELAGLCEKIKKLSPGLTLAVGFGVQNKKDVNEVLQIADIAVVGSSVIRRIETSGTKAGLSLIQKLLS
jgi:tryptophan synthase alpha subunit